MEADGEARRRARPSLTPRVSTDSLHTVTAPPTPAVKAALSPAPAPIVQVAKPAVEEQSLLAVKPATISHNFPPYPAGTGDGVEAPVSIPPSVTSRDGRKSLLVAQEACMVAHANRNAPKKRKRASDEQPDQQSGWLAARRDGHDQKVFYLELLNRLRTEKDGESGRSLSASINGLPARDKFPQFYQCIKDPQPPTLGSVERHIRTNKVPDPVDFDTELSTIFSNARFWQTAGVSSSDGEALPTFFGDVLGAQRLYQELTKGAGLPSASVFSPSALASVQFGPGQLPSKMQQTEEGEAFWSVTLPSNRLSVSRKTYLENIQYKGEALEPGSFVHLYNPTAPKLPIIGQIFKCYRLDSNGDRFCTINWYYRPSQTNHVAERTFHEQEIFKTSLFLDHKIEDFIEHVCVLHIDDYTKGRCRSWNEEMPVYVVEHTYDVETCRFALISNWLVFRTHFYGADRLDYRKLCQPAGTVDGIRPFQEQVPPPQRIKSPFVRNPVVPGPGKLAAPLRAEDEDQEPYYAALDSWPPNTGQVYGYGKMMQQKRVADAPPDSSAASVNEQSGMSSTDLADAVAPPPQDMFQGEDAANVIEQLVFQDAFAPLQSSIGASHLPAAFSCSSRSVGSCSNPASCAYRRSALVRSATGSIRSKSKASC